MPANELIGHACVVYITGHDGVKITTAIGPKSAPDEEPAVVTSEGGAIRRQQTAGQVMALMQSKIQTPPGKAPFAAGSKVMKVMGDPADPKTWKYVEI